METEKRFDLNEWFASHKKDIYMTLGAVTIARIFYKRGYKKGQDEIMNGFVAIIAGGERWTK